ncbi:MAG: hypothetical protein J6T98_05210 [Salinivirgaceae bacterium]|nr:hypothetical protein [Salinivirgaceae bacterium]
MNKSFNKIVLLVSAAVVVSCSAPNKNSKYELSPDEVNLTWRGQYNNETHRMHYTEDWAGCGWSFGDDSIKPTANFSDYDQLVVSVENITTDTTTIYLNVRYTTSSIITSASAPIVNGQTTLRVDLDPVGKSHVIEAYVMSKHPCDLVVKSAALSKAIQYGDEHELKMYDSFIDASEFDSYSDDALISFNYFADGEMTYVSDSGTIEPMNNWGIGIVCSSADVIEAVCPGRAIMLKKIGKQSYTCLLGDIRYMLEVKDDDGECGLYWVVWTGGNVTDVHTINATIREAIH